MKISLKNLFSSSKNSRLDEKTAPSPFFTEFSAPTDPADPINTDPLSQVPDDVIDQAAFAETSEPAISTPEVSTPEVSTPAASGPAASKPRGSAAERTMSGVRWTSIAMIINQCMALARSVILAHLLSREDFGLMGMAASVQNAFSLFTNFGLQNTIVSGKFADDRELHLQLNTIFTAEMIRSVVLTVLLMAASLPAARFYSDPRLMPILLVLCMTPFIQSFKNIGLTLLSRDVKFRSNTIYNILSSTLMILAPLLIAFWRRDVWALVWGQVFSSIIAVAVSYLYHPYRPRLQLDPAALKRSINFGKWFIVISAMVYVTTTADNILVGKLLGPAALGSYVVAYNVANLPSTLISKVLSGVLFPIFAKLGREETERLRSAVGRVLLVGSSMLVLVTVPMVLLAPDIIAVLYGPKWSDTAQPLRVLMLVGLFRGMIQLIAPLIMGLNRPDLEARSKIVEAVVFVTILYPLVVHFGTIGAAWAGGFIYFLSFVMRYYNASQLVPGGFTSLPRMVVTGLCSAAGGALCGGVFIYFLAGALPIVRLVIAGSATLAGCTTCLLVMRPELRAELDTLGLTKGLRRFSRRA